MKVLVLIPARYASTRFPGKPLAIIGGKPMIQRVYEQVSSLGTDVYVATDNTIIEQAVSAFGGKCIMTSEAHQSGTDRLAEALLQVDNYDNYDVVVNVQGDEPFIKPEQIQQLMSCFENAKTQIATLIKPITVLEDLHNPNKPKVVVGANNQALYFSRSPIPYLRDAKDTNWTEQYTYYKHIGIYAYRPNVLLEITKLERTPLEIAESLEQLRWLEHGYLIATAVTHYESPAVDTPEDLAHILALGLV